VRKLRDAVVKALAQPVVVQRMREQGLEIVDSSPKEFDDKIRGDIDKWRRVFKEAGIHVE